MPSNLEKYREDLPNDPVLLEQLYRPDLPHEELDLEGYNIFGIKVGGVVVRYVENSNDVVMTIEGELSEEVQEALSADLVDKLSKLEECAYRVERLR